MEYRTHRAEVWVEQISKQVFIDLASSDIVLNFVFCEVCRS